MTQEVSEFTQIAGVIDELKKAYGCSLMKLIDRALDDELPDETILTLAYLVPDLMTARQLKLMEENICTSIDALELTVDSSRLVE